MEEKNTTPQATQIEKKKSTKPSITGGILSVIALFSAGFSYLLIHANYIPPVESNTFAEKAGETVANGTVKILGMLIGVPFMIGALVLAVVAIVFTLVRIPRVKLPGFLLSLAWIGLSMWAIAISISLFNLIKAQPAV